MDMQKSTTMMEENLRAYFKMVKWRLANLILDRAVYILANFQILNFTEKENLCFHKVIFFKEHGNMGT
jgi:hypothetical protein